MLTRSRNSELVVSCQFGAVRVLTWAALCVFRVSRSESDDPEWSRSVLLLHFRLNADMERQQRERSLELFAMLLPP
jgi:hypothetical protein